MGYMLVLGRCYSCRNPFTFNAERVPSLDVKGTKYPICETCMNAANEKREEMGLEPHYILPGAYDLEEV